MSSPATTASTPDNASAREESIDRMTAWGWGLRSTFACAMPGRLKSVVKRTAPRTFSRPSSRSGPLPCGSASNIGLKAPHPFRGQPGRGQNGFVTRAAAHIGSKPLEDGRIVRLRIGLQERLDRQDKSRGAETALECIRLKKRLLDWMEFGAVRESFNRFDTRAFCLKRKSRAGRDRSTIEKHGAGAANFTVAGDAASGEMKVLAEK